MKRAYHRSIDKDFAKKVKEGDIVAEGELFGCRVIPREGVGIKGGARVSAVDLR